MKLTSKGRYAVMAMADIAKNDANIPISLAEISLRQGISLSFLEQLFLRLKKNNLVLSSRGSRGGYVLSKAPEEIKLSSIIHAVDEKIKTVKCKKESRKGCNGKSIKCITHDLWDDLESHINNFFEKNTLKDIIYRTSKRQQKEINQ
tara:strand:+ start:44 stop:484 length:441 start_codon:yes stop_codon:yes gene_type:complete